VGSAKDAICVTHFVKSPANGDEVCEDLVGLVEAMAEEVGVDLGELGSGFVAVEEAEDSPLHLAASSAHVVVNLVTVEERNGLEN
jgi:hypothetical protein